MYIDMMCKKKMCCIQYLIQYDRCQAKCVSYLLQAANTRDINLHINNKNPMCVMNAYSDCCFQDNDAQAIIRMSLSKFNTTLVALYSLTVTWPLHKNVQLVMKMC